MATTTIPWGDGSGDNITLTYTSASGSQTVVVSSDANTGLSARMKNITFTSGVGSIARILTVIQESNSEYVSITYNDVCITYNDTGIAYPYAENYIVFADSTVESILLAAGIGDGTGIKPSQAAAVTTLKDVFNANKVPDAANITTFEEFAYFTGVTNLLDTFNGSSITKVVFPAGLVANGNFYRTFDGCASLEDIDISDMVRASGYVSTSLYFFRGCTSLTTLRAASIESLNDFMHTSGYNVNDVPFGNNADTHYVYINGVELRDVVIPNTITEIRIGAFYRFNRITSVTFEATPTVTSIGQNAFYQCSSLTSITIPNTVTSIAADAFRQCSSLIGLTIPSSVSNVIISSIYESGDGTGPLIIGGNFDRNVNNSISGYTSITIGGNFTATYSAGNGVFTGETIEYVKIHGNCTFSANGYLIYAGSGKTSKVEFLEIGGTASGSGRLFYGNAAHSLVDGFIIHLGYTSGVAGTATFCCASYSRIAKIYVGDGSSAANDQAVLDMYLADSGWAQYSSKLDLWYNYSGDYKQ